MPRPGPRPYECVRRAWHSERHQPMRGLIIQQIFRLVHGNHSGTTKKNKEWQEKLPILVLKAEEIMYSKANSEGEYSNPETVWDRVNDAVDTIIRKDESTETGDLLPPCVEAALNLGCVPVRASRSQRHNNPRTYLRPAHNQESRDNNTSPKFLYENAKERPNVDSSPRLVWESNKQITGKHVASSGENLGNKNSIEVKEHSRSSVYPLYYGTSFKPNVSFREPQKTDSIIVGVPIYSSVVTETTSTEVGCLQNLFPYGKDENVRKENNKGKEPQMMGCDLSLRLGPLSDYSNSSREKTGFSHGCGGLDRSSRDEEEGHHHHHPIEEFSFFPVIKLDGTQR